MNQFLLKLHLLGYSMIATEKETNTLSVKQQLFNLGIMWKRYHSAMPVGQIGGNVFLSKEVCASEGGTECTVRDSEFFNLP